MCVQSIQFTLPFCGQSEEKEAECSRILRITAIALGIITLLVGLLFLTRVIACHASLRLPFGTLLTASGLLALLAGIFVHCLKPKPTIVDSRSSGYHSSGPMINSLTGEETCGETYYCYLDSFLASQIPEDRAVVERLKKKLKISERDFSTRLKENFGTDNLVLSLSLKTFINGERDDEYLFKLLTLIFAPTQELLAFPLDVVEKFDKDLRNILCLRMEHLQPQQEKYESQTLGELRTYTDEIFALDSSLYLYFTQKQVLYYLEHFERHNDETFAQLAIRDLFPSGYADSLPFVSERTLNILRNLPVATTNQFLHYFERDLLEKLIYMRLELDYSRVTEQQTQKLFIAHFSAAQGITEYASMQSVDIKILNQLLPKMNLKQLNAIANTHLQNPTLNLYSLSKDKIKAMFDGNPDKILLLAPHTRINVESILT